MKKRTGRIVDVDFGRPWSAFGARIFTRNYREGQERLPRAIVASPVVGVVVVVNCFWRGVMTTGTGDLGGAFVAGT